MTSDNVILGLIEKIKWLVDHPGQKAAPKRPTAKGRKITGGAGPLQVLPPLLYTSAAPALTEPAEHAGTCYSYVMPLRWSLYYALKKAQWRDLRERYKILFPGWERCDCPNGCNAN